MQIPEIYTLWVSFIIMVYTEVQHYRNLWIELNSIWRQHKGTNFIKKIIIRFNLWSIADSMFSFPIFPVCCFGRCQPIVEKTVSSGFCLDILKFRNMYQKWNLTSHLWPEKKLFRTSIKLQSKLWKSTSMHGTLTLVIKAHSLVFFGLSYVINWKSSNLTTMKMKIIWKSKWQIPSERRLSTNYLILFARK